jgi:hypothetical protein
MLSCSVLSLHFQEHFQEHYQAGQEQQEQALGQAEQVQQE